MERTAHIIVQESPRGNFLGGGVGDRGPVGPAFPFEAEIYEHTQPGAALEWIVNHNLGRLPVSVQILSPGYQEVGAEWRNINPNQLRVFFASPQSGFVRVI